MIDIYSASTNGRTSEIDPPTHESDIRPKANEEGSNKMSIDILAGSSRLQLRYIMIIIYVGSNADCWPLLRKRFRVQALVIRGAVASRNTRTR
jgi:hypothetical protein